MFLALDYVLQLLVPLLPIQYQTPYIQLIYWIQPLLRQFTLEDIIYSDIYSNNKTTNSTNSTNPVSVHDIYEYYQSMHVTSDQMESSRELMNSILLFHAVDRKGKKSSVSSSVSSASSGDEHRVAHSHINNNNINNYKDVTIRSFEVVWREKLILLLHMQQGVEGKAEDGSILSQLNWRVCGRISGDVIVNKEGEDSIVSDGYTCGLWMLFHYLTVASEVIHSISHNIHSVVNYSIYYSTQLSNRGIGALDVSHVIYTFVSQLFTCITCQTHFMHDYEHCLYNRCVMTKQKEYDLLQVCIYVYTVCVNHIHIIIMYVFICHRFG